MTLSRIQLVIGIAQYGWKMYKWLRAEQKERQQKQS